MSLVTTKHWIRTSVSAVSGVPVVKQKASMRFIVCRLTVKRLAIHTHYKPNLSQITLLDELVSNYYEMHS